MVRQRTALCRQITTSQMHGMRLEKVNSVSSLAYASCGHYWLVFRHHVYESLSYVAVKHKHFLVMMSQPFLHIYVKLSNNIAVLCCIISF